jgi:hypothetical protein
MNGNGLAPFLVVGFGFSTAARMFLCLEQLVKITKMSVMSHQAGFY